MNGGITLAKGKNANINMEDSKRVDILNAAIAEFSHGYEKASTDAIVKSAGVSKGLLFHYFGSKKELFIATYDYAVNAMLSEFYDLINLNQKDILERWRQITLLKMDLMKKHPKIFTFINNASFPHSEEVKQDIIELKSRLADKLYPKMFDDIDRTLFREDIDVDAAIHVIIFTMEGYAQSQADPAKSAEDYYGEYERYLNELERYIQFFKTSFYRQEEGK
jgi:AcrR family transcriptional regulator